MCLRQKGRLRPSPLALPTCTMQQQSTAIVPDQAHVLVRTCALLCVLEVEGTNGSKPQTLLCQPAHHLLASAVKVCNNKWHTAMVSQNEVFDRSSDRVDGVYGKEPQLLSAVSQQHVRYKLTLACICCTACITVYAWGRNSHATIAITLRALCICPPQ